MSYTINPNAKNKWARNAENTMDLSLETDASSVYLDNGRTLEQEIGEGSMVSNVATVDNSMSKVIDGTLDGAYESLVFKGKSLVNVAQPFDRGVTDVWATIHLRHSLLKQSTKYYYQVFDLPSGFQHVFTNSDGSTFLGTYTTNNISTFTTNLELTSDRIVLHINDGGKNALTQEQLGKIKVMVIEYQQGMENWDIPYFTGLCDVKMPILRNVCSLHPFPNGLLCWYDARSGEGEQTLLEDLSGNENHATLRNFQFGGTDGWQDGGIRTVGNGAATGKNSIRTNKQINNAKSMCIYFKRLGSTTPWYLFDGRGSSTIYWYSGGYTGINRSNSSKNGVQLSGNNDAVLPEIGKTAMVYIEFTDNIPITPTLMGRHSGNESLDGVFYAFMLYDRALTTEEVAMNMEYAKSFAHIKDISPLDFRNIDKTNILRTPDTVTLRSLPNGVRDELNLKTGEYVQRIGEIVFDGSEGWAYHSTGTVNGTTAYRYRTNVSNMLITNQLGETPRIFCDKLPCVRDTQEEIWSTVPSILRRIAPDYGAIYIVTSTSTVDAFKQWLSQNPITVQYELAEPITTIVEPLTIPFAYQNGHIILESGHEGQSLLPTLEYSTVVNRAGQVESVAKVIQKQEKQLTMLEKMLIQNIINLDYNNTLLTLKNEVEEML